MFALVLGLIFWTQAAVPAHGIEPDQGTGTMFLRQPDLLLTGRYWTLTIDVNITEYHRLISNYIFTVAELKNIKDVPADSALFDTAHNINALVNKEAELLLNQAYQVRKKLTNLYHTLVPGALRTKRSPIDIIGSGMRYLFGVLTTQDLEDVNEHLKSVDQKVGSILHLMNEQISYIKDNAESGQRNSHDIKTLAHTMGELNTRITAIEAAMVTKTHDETQLITSLYTIQTNFRTMENALVNIQEDINQLENAISITAVGKLSSYFLTPTQLLRILTLIEPHLPQGCTLLSALTLDNMYIYYTLSTVHLAAYDGQIRLFAQLPIKEYNKYFNLFKAISLPYQVPNQTAAIEIVPSNDFLAVTPDGQYYVEMSHDDMSHCTRDSLTICAPMRPIMKSHHPSCLFALFSGDKIKVHQTCDKMVRLHFSPLFYRSPVKNTWIYSVINEQLTIHCPGEGLNNVTTTQIVLTGTGTLVIAPNCQAFSQTFILASHTANTLSTTRQPTFSVPKLNTILTLFTNDSTPNITRTLGSSDQIALILKNMDTTYTHAPAVPFRAWQKELDYLNTPQWYKQRHIHTYGLSFTAVIVSIIVIIIIWKRTWVTQCARRLTNNKRTRQHNNVIYVPQAQPVSSRSRAIELLPLALPESDNAPPQYAKLGTQEQGARHLYPILT